MYLWKQLFPLCNFRKFVEDVKMTEHNYNFNIILCQFVVYKIFKKLWHEKEGFLKSFEELFFYLYYKNFLKRNRTSFMVFQSTPFFKISNKVEKYSWIQFIYPSVSPRSNSCEHTYVNDSVLNMKCVTLTPWERATGIYSKISLFRQIILAKMSLVMCSLIMDDKTECLTRIIFLIFFVGSRANIDLKSQSFYLQYNLIWILILF